MRKLIDLGAATPLLDIGSYARKGPGRRDRLSPAEIDLIRRTVNRTPEVIVKVLTRGGQQLKAVRAHLAYLSRGATVDIETDDGERISGKDAEKDLLDDWNLDLEEYRRGSRIGPRANQTPPKLVHKILFSMPPGTSAAKVLAAVKNLAREEFALKHRYAMVLHIDEPHPHVHMIVKAVSEQGTRLNIRKATLRTWRREFARRLREQGIEANATERAVRGQCRTSRKDAIYRAGLRGASTYLRNYSERLWDERLQQVPRIQPDLDKLVATRTEVQHGWAAAADLLRGVGQNILAREAQEFAAQFRPVRTGPNWEFLDPKRLHEYALEQPRRNR